jgi:hypothetical protein
MKSFSAFYISEGISPITYHYTEIGSALNILKERRFELSSAVGVDSYDKPIGNKRNPDPGNRLYYLSVSYAKDKSFIKPVCFVLNGRKFAEHHKGIQYDYYNSPTWENKDEGEERILSRTPYVEMVQPRDWIKEIHVYAKKDEDDHWVKENPYGLRSLCETLDIPFYLYSEKEKESNSYSDKNNNSPAYKNFRALNKINSNDKMEKGRGWRGDSISLTAQQLEMLLKIDRFTLPTYVLKDLFSVYNPSDMVQRFEIWMHGYNRLNARNDDDTFMRRKISHICMAIMHKEKLKNLKELANYVIKKYADLQKQEETK